MANSNSGDGEASARLPLGVQPSNRDGTTLRDGKLVNSYLESQPNGQYAVIKRPGISVLPSGHVTAGNALGLFSFGTLLYYIVGTSFYSSESATPIGTVDGTSIYYFAIGQTQPPNAPIIIFGNLTASYYYNIYTSTFGTVESLEGNAAPVGSIPGFVNLDGTLYYASIQYPQNIYGSGFNDLTTFDPLTVIVANSNTDNILFMASQLIYVIIFKQTITEVFYDNANPAGSPLSPFLGGIINIGYTCCGLNINGDLYWVGTTSSGGSYVYWMSNLQCTKISTPWIEKLIETSNFVNTYSWSYCGEGHIFYIITFVDINLTLAYDVQEQTWAQWVDPNGNYLPIAFSYGTTLLHKTNGYLYTIGPGTYTDFGSLMPVDIYTPNYDGGTHKRKMISLLKFNGDQTPGSVLNVRNNDYDFSPGKWTNYRNINMNSQQPMLANCGSFHRRTYHLHHSCNAPLRITSIDVEVQLGTL